MGTVLLSPDGRREARWIANWASLVRELAIDDGSLHRRIYAEINRPSVQAALKKLRANEDS